MFQTNIFKNIKYRKHIARSYVKKIDAFFNNNPELLKMQQYFPSKYWNVSTKVANDYLYLICPETAKIIADHVIPAIGENEIVAETNVGLGLITTELLDRGVKQVRMYESCVECRTELKRFASVYPGRVELFIKNIFHLGRFAYLDKKDGINRVESLLKNVPKKAWNDGPAMTIVGTMPDANFIRYLIKSLALQTGLPVYGRVQIFANIKNRDYRVLTSTSNDNLRLYQSTSALFQLLFDIQKLETFSRNIFLPWERPRKRKEKEENLVFVRINFKKELPLPFDQLLQLYFFMQQFYASGNKIIIPTIEKWIPGAGLNVLLPRLQHQSYFSDINIFTKFRELSPQHILAVYKEVRNNPAYQGSHFTTMMEHELVKSEAIETSLADAVLEKSISGDIEKLNLQDEFD